MAPTPAGRNSFAGTAAGILLSMSVVVVVIAMFVYFFIGHG
jgi:hypothetical protein